MRLTRSQAGILAGVGTIAVVLVVWLVVSGLGAGSEAQPSPGGDPGTSAPPAEESTSAGGTESSTATPSEPTEPTKPAEPDWKADAKKAAGDGLAVVVPARVPGGWVFETAAYDEKKVEWRLGFQDASGQAVKLAQSIRKVPAESIAGCRELPGSLNLTRYGTGNWTRYDCSRTVAISVELPASTVAITSSDFKTAAMLAKQLLTYESAPGGTTEDD